MSLTGRDFALYHKAKMAIPLSVLPDNRVLQVEPGTTILKAAQGSGIDITATCGGKGRCTSCRVKFVWGTTPPPTIMDELQLGGDLVREGYRLSCQCRVTEPITVQIAPPLDEQAFQILGNDSRLQDMARAGGWPSDDAISKSLEGMSVAAPSGTVTVRKEDLRAFKEVKVGFSKNLPDYPFPVWDPERIITVPVQAMTAPPTWPKPGKGHDDPIRYRELDQDDVADGELGSLSARVPPPIAAGVTDRVWDLSGLIA
jgi:ferredoxin